VRPLDTEPADLAIVIVSTNEAHWLEPCLRTIFERAGSATLDVVVVDNESTDGTAELVTSKFPQARVVPSRNLGFGHANNRGAETTSSRYVLFLNPDTEIVDGTFSDIIAALDERPTVGLAGVRQLTADGNLHPTVRRFPNAVRALGDAFAAERWPVRVAGLSERETRLDRYGDELSCDWTSGSFMFARREALLTAGLLDERYFIYSEEPDLCLRMRRAGWEIRHLPHLTIVHHAGKGGIRPRMIAQDVYTRRQYAEKHFSPAHRSVYLGAVGVRWALRAGVPGGGEQGVARRAAARRALRTLAGREEPPFGDPPPVAMERSGARA
jgi:N-acetylglucosaminyl-diphospho-decaprenol L-rhamnosyltransferase